MFLKFDDKENSSTFIARAMSIVLSQENKK